MNHLPAFHHFFLYTLCYAVMWQLICCLMYSKDDELALIIMAYIKNVTGHHNAIRDV